MNVRRKNKSLIMKEQDRLDTCLKKFREAYKKGRAQAVAYLCRIFAVDIIPTPVVEFAKELGGYNHQKRLDRTDFRIHYGRSKITRYIWYGFNHMHQWERSCHTAAFLDCA